MSEDARIDWQVAGWLAERIRGSRFILLDGVGHTPLIEDHERLNETLATWLGG